MAMPETIKVPYPILQAMNVAMSTDATRDSLYALHVVQKKGEGRRTYETTNGTVALQLTVKTEDKDELNASIEADDVKRALKTKDIECTFGTGKNFPNINDACPKKPLPTSVVGIDPMFFGMLEKIAGYAIGRRRHAPAWRMSLHEPLGPVIFTCESKFFEDPKELGLVSITFIAMPVRLD